MKDKRCVLERIGKWSNWGDILVACQCRMVKSDYMKQSKWKLLAEQMEIVLRNLRLHEMALLLSYVLIATRMINLPNENIDDVIKWKNFPRYWPFVRGIHRSPVNSPHKGQWRGAVMFSLIWAWMNARVNNREAGDLRRHRPHYGVTVME